MERDYAIRAAREDESETIARLHRLVMRANLPYLPDLHTEEDDYDYFAEVVFPGSEIWVAQDGEIFAYCAAPPGWIQHLYVHPRAQRRGVGTALLHEAMAVNDELQAWTFARNATALAFYAKHGFREVRRTDGENEEREPDVLLRWERAWTQRA